MKINKTYKSLLDKSINSMLSAIEIYNKPDFKYREETFAILSINAWELLFKAHLLKLNKYNMKSIYVMEFVLKKNGEKSTRRIPKLNRTGNPTTIGLFKAIEKIKELGIDISSNLISSLESLIELRDNAIHFHNEKLISKELQELGFACIKNFMNIIKNWEVEIDLSKYNFYLMPLAYVDSKIDSDSILTDEVSKYLAFVRNKVNSADESNEDYDVAIGIDIKFKKSDSFDGLGVKYDKDGVQVTLSEEDITQKFPLTYKDLTAKLVDRYVNFKRDPKFHNYMKGIKSNEKLCHHRKLNPRVENSQTTQFYSTNVFNELDNYYTKKK